MEYAMKAIKIFFITLAVILVLGAVVLLVGRRTGDNKAASLDKVGVKTESTAKTDNSKGKSRKANPIVKAVVNEAMDKYIENADGKAKEIADSMSEEDKETVAEIIAANVSIDTITDAQKIMADGNAEDLMEYAKENLPEEDVQQLTEILSEYVTIP
jgi:hypothetical protein